ncbi:bifunctional orotidine-5'-phosphate decarboxylase/orotate phosphoribosyltransferase [Kovacikia minuta CCNUW1]|uniref:bifunctional orotidine-5'-phosphate decarboxylase/orotate phosphoribosyltransferase n=1 Tax=Kovacikia minuta TaxID=2931930 RepID=UPI001CC988CB|nr:bifunctional orotidine-5'-phosphate decarboxylase/orotate phosphoribosyltransferase [Kovacikia minuta]UBF23580.1 bifunctional orotidine-5'-phosphate decarboxylase/orotate phosphoribosyltransferase [Kovacikia minuta CCNUW1]
MHFFDRLEAAIARNSSLLVVGLDPNPELLPSRYSNQADTLIAGLRDWLQFVIAETADLVCVYKPTLGFYEALGAPGMALLQETIAAIPPHIPVILDAKHSDLNTSTLFAQTVFGQWQVDAITLCSYAGQDHVAPFLVHSGKAVFVLCCTSNPAAGILQDYPTPETPFYLQVAKEARTWGTPRQLGLEVGTTTPDVLAKVRAIAPERVILVRSIWQEGTDLPQILTAGLDAYGEGLLIPVPQDWLSQEHPGELVQSLREQVNQIRTQIVREGSTCDLWMPDVCILNQHPHLDLILQLYDIGCILFGEFVQASGAVFPYYIDLRKIISNPQLFHQILTAYAVILKTLEFDRIAGIPYGSLPTATGLALHLNRPMIFPRKEVKAHGTRRVIEGNFEPGETVVVVDDILISGNSAMEGAAKLQSAGLMVQDIVVFMDHEQGVKDRLSANGYRAHSVLTISEITETLYQAGRINEAQYEAFADVSRS